MSDSTPGRPAPSGLLADPARHLARLVLAAGTLLFAASPPALADPDDTPAQTTAPSRGDDLPIPERLKRSLRNRDAIRQCVCRMEIRKFDTPDPVEILRGRAQPVATASALFVRDGARERREVIVLDEVLQKGLQQGWIDIDPKLQLLDGDRGLYFAKDLNSAVLYSPQAPADEIVIGPFTLGRFFLSHEIARPDTILRSVPQIATIRRLEGPPSGLPREIATTELVGLEYETQANGLTSTVRVYLAPHHGHLPVLCLRLLDGRLMSSAIVTDIRTLPGGRYFPLRSVHIEHAGGGSGRASTAIETKVTHLDIDQPVPPEHFRVELARNTILRDLADDSQMLLPGPRVVSLRDLDELFLLTAAAARRERGTAR